tara:strand:+ start:37 stop:804 length:768 start_codon:yes stop_codon:yes gene_type:complete
MGYFNIEFKPSFSGVATMATTYTNGDVLFDWQEIDMPGGHVRIHGISMVAQGTNGATQGFTTQLLFAHLDQSNNLPISIGTTNATASGINHYSQLCGTAKMELQASGLDFFSVFTTGGTDGDYDGGLVIETNKRRNLDTQDLVPNMINTGKIAIAGINTAGAADFNTGVLLNQNGNQAALAAPTPTTLTVDGVNATKVFMRGDVIHAADGALIGTILSVAANGLSIVVDNVAAPLLDDDELMHSRPVKVILHCEM